MSTITDQTEDLVRRYLRAFNEGDEDEMTAVLSADVVEHGTHEQLHGIEAIIERRNAYFEAFPDYTGQTDELLVDGNLAAIRYTVSGTHTGEYLDVEPSGQQIEWTGLAMYRIENDEIVEAWIEADRLGLLEQLELVDPPAHLRI